MLCLTEWLDECFSVVSVIECCAGSEAQHEYYRVACGRQTLVPDLTQDNSDENPSVVLWRRHCFEAEKNLTLSLPQLINILSEVWHRSALVWWSQSASFAADLNGFCFDLMLGLRAVVSLERCSLLS